MSRLDWVNNYICADLPKADLYGAGVLLQGKHLVVGIFV